MSRHFIPTLLSVRMEGWRSLTSVTTRLLPCVFRLVKSASSSWPLTSLLFFCCFCGFLAATVRPPSFSNLIFYSFNKLSPSFPPSVLSPLLSSYTSTLFGLSFPFLPPDSFIPLFLFIQQEPFLIPFLVVLSSFLLPHLSFTTHTTDTHTYGLCVCVCPCVSVVCVWGLQRAEQTFVCAAIHLSPACFLHNKQRGGWWREVWFTWQVKSRGRVCLKTLHEWCCGSAQVHLLTTLLKPAHSQRC